jgi:hypothetical protein
MEAVPDATAVNGNLFHHFLLKKSGTELPQRGWFVGQPLRN